VDVNEVRREIEAAVRHEGERGTLRRLVVHALRKASPGLGASELADLADEGVQAIREFVQATPTVIESTMRAARNAGVVEQVAPIFETALSYMSETADFIPDRLGLAGMLDDAYLIHGLMQEISERHRILTGTPLLPSNNFAMLPHIKRIIGEPIGTRLDVAIVAFARRQNVRDTIDQIVTRIGDAGLAMELPVSVQMPGEASVLGRIPSLDLASIQG
jgi:uncharacterized membrane protein YkvA (DUF1232 family)